MIEAQWFVLDRCKSCNVHLREIPPAILQKESAARRVAGLQFAGILGEGGNPRLALLLRGSALSIAVCLAGFQIGRNDRFGL